jgi:hypothetical protein
MTSDRSGAPQSVPTLTEVVALPEGMRSGARDVMEAPQHEDSRPEAPPESVPSSIASGGVVAPVAEASPSSAALPITAPSMAAPSVAAPAIAATDIAAPAVAAQSVAAHPVAAAAALPAAALPAASDAAARTAVAPAVAAPAVAAPALAPSSLPDEDELTARILADLQRQLDAVLEYRIREALAPVLARATDALVRDARHELTRTLRDVVARTVAQELLRQRTR